MAVIAITVSGGEISTYQHSQIKQNIWRIAKSENSISDDQTPQQEAITTTAMRSINQEADIVRPAFSMFDVRLLVYCGIPIALASAVSLFWTLGTVDLWALSGGGTVFGTALLAMARLRALNRKPIPR